MPPPPAPVVVGQARGAKPSPSAKMLQASHYAFTHPGGSKPLDSTNQDTWFVHAIDKHNAIFAVFDGHGSENGDLAAKTAADVVRSHLAANFKKLQTDPEAICVAAFELAHKAVLDKILRSAPLKLRDGVPVDEWTDDEGVLQTEVADGGTTATVICLLEGATLVYAQARRAACSEPYPMHPT